MKKIKREDEEDKEEGSPSRRKRKVPRTSERRVEPFQGRNQSQNQKWTPLNTTLSNVLMEIKRDPAFRWPPRMRTPTEKRNNQKFCEYHNDHGHQIEDCMVLRKEIELLIQNGKLVKFVANEKKGTEEARRSPQQRIEGPSHKMSPEDRRDRRERREHSRGPMKSRRELDRRNDKGMNNEDQPHPQNQLIVREIHTISGGLAGRGESTSTRKAHARGIHIEEVCQVGRPRKVQKRDVDTISFFDEDANGVSMPHDDALVVTMTVANHAIHRILVDNGSSAKIIYWSVIQQIGISRDRIKPFGSPLVGFMGEQVQTMKVISLPITCGASPRDSTIIADFLVIDQPSAYNAIIGRPALKQLRAITSTYHLMMKFPTKNGIGELKENQPVVKRCYNISLKRVVNPKFLPVSLVSGTNEVVIKGTPVETLEEVVVRNEKILKIGSHLKPDI
jgi:hypothetical protein